MVKKYLFIQDLLLNDPFGLPYITHSCHTKVLKDASLHNMIMTALNRTKLVKKSIKRESTARLPWMTDRDVSLNEIRSEFRIDH